MRPFDGWYSLTLFWPICTGSFCSAYFVLSLFLHRLIMFRTTLYCDTFCTEPPFTSAYYVPDNFALWPILYWDQLWIGLLCIGEFCTGAKFALTFILGRIGCAGIPECKIVQDIKHQCKMISGQNWPKHKKIRCKNVQFKIGLNAK